MLALTTDRAAGCGAAALGEHLAGRIEQLVVRHHPGDHAQSLRLRGGQGAAGEHQVAGADRTDQPGQHLGCGVGDSAVQLRHPEDGPLTDHRHVGAQCDLRAAA